MLSSSSKPVSKLNASQILRKIQARNVVRISCNTGPFLPILVIPILVCVGPIILIRLINLQTMSQPSRGSWIGGEPITMCLQACTHGG